MTASKTSEHVRKMTDEAIARNIDQKYDEIAATQEQLQELRDERYRRAQEAQLALRQCLKP